MSKQFIVLNGRRYDANSGALIGLEPIVAKPTPAQTRDANYTPAVAHGQLRTATPPPPLPTAASPSSQAPIKRTPAAHLVPHKPQGGKTLMRRAVTKPVPQPATPTTTHYPVTARPVAKLIARKHAAEAVDASRLARAKTIAKSARVGKFTAQARVIDIVPRKPVQPALHHASRPVPPAISQPRSRSVSHATQRVAQPSHLFQSKQPTQPTQSAQAIHSAQPPISPVEHVQAHIPPNARLSMFEEALASARSHETPPPAQPRRSYKKIVLVATTALVVLVIVGIGAVNRHAIELQLASWRVGFTAATPSYVVAGYTPQLPAVRGKSISINYVSPTDSSTYAITQEPSDWNSDTLANDITSHYGNSYRTLHNRGRTIFVYNDGKAAWIDGGILYTITGNTPLDADQIISIVAGLR